MTTIFSVLDNAAQLPQRDEPRQPAKDFAHELTKPAPQAGPSTQNDPKAAAGQGFDEQPSFEPNELDSAPVVDEALPKASLQAAMRQPMPTAEPVDVAPVGVTETLLEARVFGWHAMAQAYLSELTAADGSIKPFDANQVGQAAMTAQAEPADASAATVVAAGSQAAEVVAGAQPIIATAIQPTTVATDEAPSASAPASTVAGGGAEAVWAERSLRFTLRRDGSRVAWIRDFRLSDAEASHLVDWVRNDARQKGAALGRIMLNGREVWASPNPNIRSTP